MTKMKVGINYAWKNYAWDFGLPPRRDTGSAWGPRAAWQATIDAELDCFAASGLFCVRWFLLGDGTTYGVEDGRPHLDSANSGQWRFDDPPPLSDEFLKDFDQLLARCKAAGILLLPSLIDFHFCLPGILAPGSSGIVKCGRGDVIIDPHKRERFFDRVLQPLLEVAATHRSSIYAFELMNEPEWCTRRPGLTTDLLNSNRIIPFDDMCTFLRAGAKVVNDAGFKSTVGFALHSSLSSWDSPGLDLTLHQFHYYAEPAELPPNMFDPRWPAIVGEFATAPHRPWPELNGAQDVLSRLRHVESKGYEVAFLWSSNREEEHSADPPAVDFSEPNRALIRRYTQS